LPERCRNEVISEENWEFLSWQAEEKGYAVVRTIDQNWIYWSILADKLTLLNMMRVLIY